LSRGKTLLRATLILVVIHLFSVLGAKAQQEIHLSGKVINKKTQRVIPGVAVNVLPPHKIDTVRTKIGVATDKNGEFDISFRYQVPFKLKFTHISYRSKEITIDDNKATDITVKLVPKVIKSGNVVVRANLISKEELKNPVTVDKVSTVDVKQLTSFNTFNLVSTLQEVDIATQSMTMKSVNTRGFNASANKRFLQLTDGVDNEAPGLSFPIGNLMGPPGIDISSIEVLPGPSSAKYGSSAMNGVLLTKTRDPFSNQGLTLNVKGGANDFHFGSQSFFSVNGNEMYDISGRFAKAINDNIAFKFTTELKGGTDWKAVNYDNIGPGKLNDRPSYLLENTTKPPQPGYNGVNIYGDENYNYLPVGSKLLGTDPGGLVPVARTGYKEKYLVDYDITTRKFSGAIHYKFGPSSRLITEGRYGFTNSLYTGDSRIRLDGFEMYQGKINLKVRNFNLLEYSTWQNSGQSYDVSRLADGLINAAKSDANWYRDFKIAYKQGIQVLEVPSHNYKKARQFADGGITLLNGEQAVPRFQPGTERFRQKVEQLKNNTDFEHGAAIRDDSKLYHIQSSYELDDLLRNSKLDFGGNFRFYDINSHGTVFPDTASNDISNYQFGGYVSMTNHLYQDRLTVRSALRIDKNENFEFHVSPTIALNYAVNQKNYFRFSYHNGFRYPGLREQFINKNLGKAWIVGGLPGTIDQYKLPQNSITAKAVEEFNKAVIHDMNKNPTSPDKYNRTQAELNNLSILKAGILSKGAFSGIKSETANTFEVGYKRLFSKNFFLDMNYYVSFYQNFIGITRVVKPRTSPTRDLFTASEQINNSLENDKYYVYSNSQGLLTVQGASFKIKYLSGGFLLGINGNWADLIKDSNDPITPGFNTPPLKFNFEWGDRSITENVGFKVVYKYRLKYNWKSPFVDGQIPRHGHFDFQFNIKMPSLSGNLKFGITNWGIKRYYNIYGGPFIGSIFFATFTFDQNMF